ncbi:uncharacterized protein LOC127706436 [Mytilus californianus]|uniref:uncharacterized protein LOC127706436 n=1 Tax=Mytilus californianus TaxID=6549 RepID=UPI002245FAE8|nr:uncharacterized protein LOC127706436 [Mytilus californianus]
MSSLKLDRQNIDKEIQKARHAINEHFDRLEEELMKELTRVVDYESRKIRNILASLERTEKEIVELQVTLASLKQHASAQQSFQVSKQTQHKLIDTNNFIQSMHDNNELSDVNISLQMDDFVKIVKQNIIKTGEIVVQTSPVYTALMKQEFKEAKYAELSEIVVQTSSDYTSLMRQKNKGAKYSELGESDVQITQAYTSLMIQEDKEEAYTELGEIVEQTSPIYTSSTGQENREEAYTELGEIVEQTDPFNMSIVRQKNKQAQSNVSKSKSAQENEYDTIPTTEHDTDFCFIVMVKPGKDAKKFGLNNKYRLYVKPEGFTLEDIKKRTLKCHWPYDIVRQYGKSKEGREIVITVGRKHILGPGNVTFRCDSRDNLDRLFRLVPIFIKRIQSAVKP